MQQLFKLAAIILILTGTVLSGVPGTARAADHGDAPLVREQANLDINDVYLFPSPVTATNVVMIMTVSPVSGISGPLYFHSAGNYQFVVDNNGDAKPDIIFTAKFGKAAADGSQKYTLTKSNGAGKKTSKIASGNTGTELIVKGGGSVEAKLFDDPFFFDLLSFKNSLSFCGPSARNFFAGLNTLAIVLEIPAASIEDDGATSFGVWARSFQNPAKGEGKPKQFDRMGRPAINTVLVTAANKDKFNKSSPLTDRAQFQADAVSIIQSLGNTPSGAQALADILFPDILTIDLSKPTAYPNGRALTDDVIDGSLQLITTNQAATDCVANDSTFLSTFPYLAAKNP